MFRFVEVTINCSVNRLEAEERPHSHSLTDKSYVFNHSSGCGLKRKDTFLKVVLLRTFEMHECSLTMQGHSGMT